MVAETWILKMSNQVSSNLKHAFHSEPNKKKPPPPKKRLSSAQPSKLTIGILSFEVANVMSKTVHLHKSLSDSEISKLKAEILGSQGVRNLVSGDESRLLQLALAEKLHDLNRVAAVVSRLGKKCVEPALQGFEHVYGDLTSGAIDVKELGFLVKDMDGMVRKMERYVNATANLYSEMEVLSELEQATKKFQMNQHEESRRAFEQKVIWQKQDVRHLKEVSIWNQSYDKVVELLVRTVCTIYARICAVFGESVLQKENSSLSPSSSKDECWEVSGQMKRAGSRGSGCYVHSNKSGQIERAVVQKRDVKPRVVDSRKNEISVFEPGDVMFPCGISPGRLFMECLSLTSSGSKLDYDDEGTIGDNDDRSSHISSCKSTAACGLHRGLTRLSSLNLAQGGGCKSEEASLFGPKSKLTVYAPPSTLGGCALALHYANVIIVIEKLLRYPHLVGEEARDDLYQMLPTSLRMSLRTKLKSYVKNLAIYDAPLAHDWKEAIDGILRWLAPLAHNMIRWQSERNVEQHQIAARTNVLLLQTLYFADRGRTEAAICELLVGLNYICRYEHQQNALLDCASSFDFEDCMEWQMQCRAAFLN
ncbi:Protein PSK SIMULATOR 1 [Linum perenne]